MSKTIVKVLEYSDPQEYNKCTTDLPVKVSEPAFPEQLFNQRQLRRMCGDVSDMTIWRMRKNKILPEPVVLNGRNYWKRSELVPFFMKLGTGQ